MPGADPMAIRDALQAGIAGLVAPLLAAGLFQAAGIPSITRGPGRIAEAHRPGESIGRADLEERCAMLRRVVAQQS